MASRSLLIFLVLVGAFIIYLIVPAAILQPSQGTFTLEPNPILAGNWLTYSLLNFPPNVEIKSNWYDRVTGKAIATPEVLGITSATGWLKFFRVCELPPGKYSISVWSTGWMGFKANQKIITLTVQAATLMVMV